MPVSCLCPHIWLLLAVRIGSDPNTGVVTRASPWAMSNQWGALPPYLLEGVGLLASPSKSGTLV